MLYALPAEAILEILSYLPVQTLRAFQLVSRDWESFIRTNESFVYKKAAFIHRFLPSSNFISVSELQSVYPIRSLSRVHDWKSFCRSRCLIERSWSGRGPSEIKRFTATGDAVHRIKVDEDAGYIITTSKVGGLAVTDMTSNELLWSLHKVSH